MVQPSNGRDLCLLSKQQNVSETAWSLVVQERDKQILQAIKMHPAQYPPATEINVDQYTR